MEPSDPPAPSPPEDGPVLSITGLRETADGAGEDAAPAPTPVAAPAPAPVAASGPEPAPAPVPLVLSAAALPEGGPVAAKPAEPWSPSITFMAVSAFIVAALDLGSKEWATRTLAGPDLKRTMNRIEAIPGHLDFIFAQNPGGAWSFLRSVPDGLRRPFFLFVSAAAIVFIVSVYRRLDRRQWAMRWGLPLALGGAIGNLADRVRYGWVVDFIDFYVKRAGGDFHWPTFNIADVAIVFGVGLMAIDLFSLRKMGGPENAPSPETASGAA